MIEPAAALKHWGAWAVDTGNWRRTCSGIEKRWVNDPSRYVHPDDMGKRFRFKYDQRTGEAVEVLVNTMHDQEKLVLRARHVHWPHLADDIIARRLGLPARNLDTLLLAAHLHFGQCWLRWQQGAA